MKPWVLFVLLELSNAGAVASTGAQQRIWFEGTETQKASPSVQIAMRRFAIAEFNDCRGEPDFDHEKSKFFRAVPLQLTRTHKSNFLVTPGDSCISVFHGAHSTAFWILEKSQNGFRLLFSGRRDGITLLNTYTNGYRDIDLLYGVDDPVRINFRRGAYSEKCCVKRR